ncbi:MAG: FIVAR domain-containing protein, partial [Propionibacteriaceae bacterium]|nr:FIVAR domain-containing protein [Propionibacteriaceae bacterium]
MRSGVVFLASLAVVLPMQLGSTVSTKADSLVPQFDPDTGVALNVFTDRSKWLYDQIWVEVPGIDSDGDGLNDLIHVDVVRQGETATDGLKVPVILTMGPYYARNTNVQNHSMYTEVGEDPPYANEPEYRMTSVTDTRGPKTTGSGTNQYTYGISTTLITTWVPRGFAVAHAENLGSGWSTGCPTAGDYKERAGVKAVVEYLAGMAGRAFTSLDRTTVVPLPSWTNNKVAMTGTSYLGTNPIMAASVNARGLAAIMPDSAINSWYYYYRANGSYKAPGGYPGEDTDIHAKYNYSSMALSHADDPLVCERESFADMVAKQDRASGDYTPYFDERNYIKTAPNWDNIGIFVVAGYRDWNVMTSHSVDLIEALRADGRNVQVWLHQRGHGSQMPDDAKQNAFFTHFLYGGAPQGGTNKTWVISSKYLEQSSVSWTNVLPEEYDVWPPADTENVKFTLTASDGSEEAGTLSTVSNTDIGTIETFTDETYPQVTGWDYGNSTNSDAPYAAYPAATATSGRTVAGHRLIYTSDVFTEDTHLIGAPEVTLRFALNNKPTANLSVLLVSYPAAGTFDGKAKSTTPQVVSRGWVDPRNRSSISYEDPTLQGRFYTVKFKMESKDYYITAGSKLGFVVLSTDPGYSMRPKDGTSLSINPAFSFVSLPIVGGAQAVTESLAGSVEVLQAAIDVYALFEAQSGRYTPASYAPLAAALQDARDIVAAGSATAQEIADAIAALKTAADGLVTAVDKSALIEFIDIAEAILADPSDYVPSSLTDLQTALTAANTVANDPAATESDVLSSAIALAQAIAKIQVKGDKSLLSALVDLADSLDSSKYTPGSWAAVADALADAQAVLADPNASEAEVEAAYDALIDALDGLVLAANKGGLVTAIGVAEQIIANSSSYVAASISSLPSVLAAAQAVNADPEATSAQVTSAQAALITAIAKARLKPVSPSPEPTPLFAPATAALAADEPSLVSE